MMLSLSKVACLIDFKPPVQLQGVPGRLTYNNKVASKNIGATLLYIWIQ